MKVQKPFNFKKWVEENRDKLKPPVSNKNLFPVGKDFIVMVVGGPNARKDYHYNETEEFFYQIEGYANVITQHDGEKVINRLGPGDMLLLPAKTPHSPGREAKSIGLVVERVRQGTGLKDGLMWFCDNCNHQLHEVKFELINIETDFQPHFKHFYTSEDLKTCDKCGTVMDTDPKYLG